MDGGLVLGADVAAAAAGAATVVEEACAFDGVGSPIERGLSGVPLDAILLGVTKPPRRGVRRRSCLQCLAPPLALTNHRAVGRILSDQS